MSFGYSVGDFIAGAELTYKLIRILKDSQGASIEYQEAMMELNSMQEAFLRVSQLCNNPTVPRPTVNGVAQIVLSAMDILTTFLQKCHEYRKRLGTGVQYQLRRTRSDIVGDSWAKVGWALFKKEELKELRASLQSRLNSINLLLSVAAYSNPIPQTIPQFQALPPTDGGGDLKELARALHMTTLPGPVDDPAIAHMRELHRLSRKWLSNLTIQGVQGEVVEKLRGILYDGMGGHLESDLLPIRFIDVQGRRFTLPFHSINTWEGMHELVQEAYWHFSPLHPQVKAGCYDLVSSDGQILIPSAWDKLIRPNMEITMVMWPPDEEATREVEEVDGFLSESSETPQINSVIANSTPQVSLETEVAVQTKNSSGTKDEDIIGESAGNKEDSLQNRATPLLLPSDIPLPPSP